MLSMSACAPPPYVADTRSWATGSHRSRGTATVLIDPSRSSRRTMIVSARPPSSPTRRTLVAPSVDGVVVTLTRLMAASRRAAYKAPALITTSRTRLEAVIRRWRFSCRARRSTARRRVGLGTNCSSSRWLYIVDLQCDVETKLLQRSMRVLLHRSHGRPHRRGHIPLRQIGEVAQRDHLPLSTREPGDGVDETQPFETVAVTRRRDPCVRVVELDRGTAPPNASYRQVGRDASNPRLVVPGDRRPSRQRARQSLLRDLLGISAVAQQPEGDAVRDPRERVETLVEARPARAHTSLSTRSAGERLTGPGRGQRYVPGRSPGAPSGTCPGGSCRRMSSSC